MKSQNEIGQINILTIQMFNIQKPKRMAIYFQ